MLKNNHESSIYDIGKGFPMQFKVVKNFNRRQHTTALELSKIAFKDHKYLKNDETMQPHDDAEYVSFDKPQTTNLN